MNGWEQLVALAEAERAHALAGRWEDVAACSSERAARACALPQATEAERAVLERLAALQAELGALIATARAATGRELAALGAGRRAVRGYGALAR